MNAKVRQFRNWACNEGDHIGRGCLVHGDALESKKKKGGKQDDMEAKRAVHFVRQARMCAVWMKSADQAIYKTLVLSSHSLRSRLRRPMLANGRRPNSAYVSIEGLLQVAFRSSKGSPSSVNRPGF